MTPHRKAARETGRFFHGDFGHTHYSHIYAIGPREGGNLKFGQALNVKSRFSGIQTGSPVILKLHGSLYLPTDTESAIHRHLADDRSHGEWFYPSKMTMRVLDLITRKESAELLYLVGLFRYLPISMVNQRNFEQSMAAPLVLAPPQMTIMADLVKGYRREDALQPK